MIIYAEGSENDEHLATKYFLIKACTLIFGDLMLLRS